MGFEKWAGCHQDGEQAKRIAKAKTAECTPLSVSSETQSGEFSGSSGVYHTTLEECSCVDFRRRKLPCKHMYRLAMELGAIEGEVASDASKVKRPKPAGYSLADAVAIIENLSDDARKLLHGILSSVLYGEKKEKVGIKVSRALEELESEHVLDLCDDPETAMEAYTHREIKDALVNAGVEGFKKNMKKELMIAWAFENVPNANEIIPGCACVKISDKFVRPSRRLYSYLNRREGAVEYWEGGEYYYPDDEVTALLRLYGTYPTTLPDWCTWYK